MSVVNEFDAKAVRYGHDPKQVYIIDIDSKHMLFKYDIFCRAGHIGFFFNVREKKALIYMKTGGYSGEFKCAVMKFWIENDCPVMSANWMMGQGAIIANIFDEFKQQYASCLLDDVINT